MSAAAKLCGLERCDDLLCSEYGCAGARAAPLSKAENRAFCRMARLYRRGKLPERDQAVYAALRERVHTTMPTKAVRP